MTRLRGRTSVFVLLAALVAPPLAGGAGKTGRPVEPYRPAGKYGGRELTPRERTELREGMKDMELGRGEWSPERVAERAKEAALEAKRAEIERSHVELSASVTGLEQAQKALAQSEAKNIVVGSPDQLRVARQAATKDQLVLLKRTAAPIDLRILNRKIEGVSIFHSIPRSRDEAVAIHGKRGAAFDDARWGQLADSFRDCAPPCSATRIEASFRRTAAENAYDFALNAPAERLTILFGEIRGGAIRFADGSALPVGDLPADKPIAVIGCLSLLHSAPEAGGFMLGTGRRISYPEAIGVAKDLSRATSRTSSLRDLLKAAEEKNTDFLVGTIAANVVSIDLVRGSA